jgi:type III secretory pathway component EscR
MQSEISKHHVAISTFTINFYLAAFLSQPCGHKHIHNKKILLLPSFHSLVARSTFTIIFLICYLPFIALELL